MFPARSTVWRHHMKEKALATRMKVVDLDWKVLESTFEGCLVLLCNVHTARYFREKVLTGKSYWGDIADKNLMNGSQKEDLLPQILLVRDAPSEELYREREKRN